MTDQWTNASTSAWLNNQNNQIASWNQQSNDALNGPLFDYNHTTPYGPGGFGTPYYQNLTNSLSPSFGTAADPGTYSPGNRGNLSSYSGSSLGGGGSVFDTGTSGVNTYNQPGVGGYDDPSSWTGLNDQQQNYIQAHKSAYGYTPEAGFFNPGGGWDQYYGPQGSLNPNKTVFDTGTTPYNDYGQPGSAADPNANPQGSGSQLVAGWGNLSPVQQNYVQSHLERYGYAPAQNFFQAGGDWDKYYGPNGLLAQNPATPSVDPLGEGAQAYYGYLTDRQQDYVQSHLDRYGYAPDQNFFQAGGGWDTNYGAHGVLGQSDDSPYGQPTGIGDSGYGDGYGGYGNFRDNPWDAPAGANIADPKSYWVQQQGPNQWRDARAPYASELANDPAKMYDMAVRMYLEATGDPQARTAIAEAMLNRTAARTSTKVNPLRDDYFPQFSDYKNDYAKWTRDLKNNPELLGRIYGEIGRAVGGTNISQGATDWASKKTADYAATKSTETWKSPIEGERFFRKDIKNSYAGPTAAQEIQDWYSRMMKWPQ
jgi:hypothetical protein